jgi:hypothetical protein
MLDLPLFTPLLWDIEPASLDSERHAGFLIRRALERGTWTEWRIIRAHYGDERIRREVADMTRLEPKALAYVAAILDLPLESFPCFATKRSQPAPWIS